MKKFLYLAAFVVLAPGLQSHVVAADSAASQATANSCEEKAVDKNGKKLSGAAKTSFIKKCEADAKSAK